MIKGTYLSYNEDLTQVKEIRKEVFQKELNISADVEEDGEDMMAMHAIVDFEGRKVGTGRMRFDGDTFILDKVAVLADCRGNGYGDFVVRMLLDKAFLANGTVIYSDATKETEHFFEKLGFVEIDEPYEEEGIIYIPMKVEKGKVKTKCGGHH